jgi:protein-disulfide isomerase
MKRLLPFIIIALVALATVTSALLFYRSKMQQPLTPRPPIAAATPTGSAAPGSSATPAAETAAATPEEDKSLHIRGPRDAPVTMEVYGDFQCPSCGFASKIIRQLEEDYPQQLRVIFYEFPLAMHAHAVDAARAAEAASLQGKFWEMHDQLYEYQAIWSKASDVHFFFENYAEAIGLDVARFRADCQSADVQQAVISQGQAGAARGVQNTPTIFINGHMLRAEFSREKFDDAIKAALAAKGKS